MKLVWTRGSRADRAAIYNYIEAENPRAAIELDEQFDRRAVHLAAHPKIGRGGRVQNTRELVVQPSCLLVYDIGCRTSRQRPLLVRSHAKPSPGVFIAALRFDAFGQGRGR